MGRRSRKRGSTPARGGDEARGGEGRRGAPDREGDKARGGAGRRGAADRRGDEARGGTSHRGPPARAGALAAQQRTRPPWHPVPLTELCVLLGLVLLVWGVMRRDDPAGRVLLVTGMVLGSLGGLEAALREHFTGGRSHSALLAGLPAVLVAGVLFFARAPWVLIPLGTLLVFAAAFTALRRAHRRGV